MGPQATTQQRQSLPEGKQQPIIQATQPSQPPPGPAAAARLPARPKHRLAHARPVPLLRPALRPRRPLHAGRGAPVCDQCAGHMLPNNATLSLHLGALLLSHLAKRTEREIARSAALLYALSRRARLQLTLYAVQMGALGTPGTLHTTPTDPQRRPQQPHWPPRWLRFSACSSQWTC